MSVIEHEAVADDAEIQRGGAHLDREEAYRLYVLDNLETIYRFARSLAGSAADADDLAQEALLRAYRAIDRFDGRQPTAWLRTIVRNVHYSRWRTRRHEYGGDPEPVLGVLHDRHAGPEDAVVAADGGAAMVALEQLTEELRAVAELVDVAGLRYREAAVELDIPIGTVMSRLHRARRQMRAHVERSRTVAAQPRDVAVA